MKWETLKYIPVFARRWNGFKDMLVGFLLSPLQTHQYIPGTCSANCAVSAITAPLLCKLPFVFFFCFFNAKVKGHVCQVVYLQSYVHHVFDLSFSAVFLRLSLHYFYLKKANKKKDKWKGNCGFSTFLSSFSAFLYEMAALSKQYFNQNEPKSPF